MQIALSLAQNVTGSTGDLLSSVSSDVQIFCRCDTGVRRLPRKAGHLFLLPKDTVKYISSISRKNVLTVSY